MYFYKMEISEKELIIQELTYRSKKDKKCAEMLKQYKEGTIQIKLEDLGNHEQDEERIVSSKPCPNCSFEYSILQNLQLRSADEASVFRYLCGNCGNFFSV